MTIRKSVSNSPLIPIAVFYQRHLSPEQYGSTARRLSRTTTILSPLIAFLLSSLIVITNWDALAGVRLLYIAAPTITCCIPIIFDMITGYGFIIAILIWVVPVGGIPYQLAEMRREAIAAPFVVQYVEKYIDKNVMECYEGPVQRMENLKIDWKKSCDEYHTGYDRFDTYWDYFIAKIVKTRTIPSPGDAPPYPKFDGNIEIKRFGDHESWDEYDIDHNLVRSVISPRIF